MKTADAHNKDLMGTIELPRLAKKVGVTRETVEAWGITKAIVKKAVAAERERIRKAVEKMDGLSFGGGKKLPYPSLVETTMSATFGPDTEYVRRTRVLAIINQEDI